MRSGNVALIGRTNVGKSTLLNAALGEPLAITSALPQTTRDTLLGVVTLPESQIAFVDTPGLHRPRTELGRRMNSAAIASLRDADLAVLVTDTHRAGATHPELPEAAAATPKPGALPPGDLEVIALIPAELPCLLVINKVDRLANKGDLLPTIAAFASVRNFVGIVPASAFDPRDVERLLGIIAGALPERPALHDSDTLTDRPALYFVREYVREQVLRQTGREVPHAVAVTIESATDRGDLLVVQATIHVEKPGQRGILVGARGARLREIGTAARLRIEDLLGRRVYLELFVRVTPRWKFVPRQLAELGYEAPGGMDPRPANRAEVHGRPRPAPATTEQPGPATAASGRRREPPGANGKKGQASGRPARGRDPSRAQAQRGPRRAGPQGRPR